MVLSLKYRSETIYNRLRNIWKQ